MFLAIIVLIMILAWKKWKSNRNNQRQAGFFNFQGQDYNRINNPPVLNAYAHFQQPNYPINYAPGYQQFQPVNPYQQLYNPPAVQNNNFN